MSVGIHLSCAPWLSVRRCSAGRVNLTMVYKREDTGSLCLGVKRSANAVFVDAHDTVESLDRVLGRCRWVHSPSRCGDYFGLNFDDRLTTPLAVVRNHYYPTRVVVRFFKKCVCHLSHELPGLKKIKN